MLSQGIFSPTRSIKVRLLLMSLGMAVVAVLVVAAITFNAVERVGVQAQQISGDAIRQQVEEYMVQLTQRAAAEYEMTLEQAISDVKKVAASAAQVFDSADSLSAGNFWPAEEHMFVAPDGQYKNGPKDTSSVFAPKTVPVDEKLVNDVEVGAYLDLVLKPVFENNPNAEALYFATTHDVLRYYPNVDLGSLVPPDFTPTQRVWFVGSTPEKNPDRAAWWTPPYQDATGLGLVTTAAMPVYSGRDEFIGVVGFDVTLTEMRVQIEQTEFLKAGYSFLVDENGGVIAMPEQAYHDMLGRPPQKNEFGTDLTTANTAFSSVVARMIQGGSGFESVRVNDQEMFVAYAPLKSTGWSLGSVVAAKEVLGAVGTIQSEMSETRRTLLVTRLLPAVGAILLLLSIGSLLWTNRLIRPVQKLAAVAQKIGAGEWDIQIPATGNDEVGVLARTFGSMAVQLRELVARLEQRVAERTSALERRSLQMQTAAEVARDITMTSEAGKLLDQAASLIQDRFGFYFVAIFLVDDLGEYAHLQAAAGQAGEQLLARRMKLRVGQQGIVGNVAKRGEPRIALDVGEDRAYFQVALLPDTRSELALPLKVGGKVTGVLDVQSVEEAAFDQDDITILQTLADQISIAIDHARLIERLEATLQETRAIQERQIQESWSQVRSLGRLTAFEYDQISVRPVPPQVSPQVWEKLKTGKAVAYRGGLEDPQGKASHLAAPVMLRGQMIGVIRLENDDLDHDWSSDEIAVVEATASQAALTLENARLYQETQEQASRERFIGAVTGKMQRANSMEGLVQQAMQELQAALDASYVVVHLGTEDELLRRLNGNGAGNGHSSPGGQE